MGGVTRKNLRRWAEAKQRRAEQAMLARGRWVYFSDGTGVFLEDPYPPFGTYVAPTVWLPMVEQPLFPDAVGKLLHAALHPEPTPGLPYTHTFNLPPTEYDEDGAPLPPRIEPSLTVERVTAKLAAYARAGVRAGDTGLHPLLLDHGIDRHLS